MKFEESNVHDQLLAASDSELDCVDFGVIGLDPDHRVVSYNKIESTFSGLSAERVIGRHFFTEVAPCTNNFMVAHRFETEEALDATIGYIFTLRMRPTPVRLRLLRRPSSERQFLLVAQS